MREEFGLVLASLAHRSGSVMPVFARRPRKPLPGIISRGVMHGYKFQMIAGERRVRVVVSDMVRS